jgi:predicted RNA-binding Zn ribbon-like protein
MKSTQAMRAYYSPLGRIRMLGGNPALDMANTLHWRGARLVDFATDYRALAEWAVPALLLTEREKTALLEQAAKEPDAALRLHQQWLDLRSALKVWLLRVQGHGADDLNFPVEPELQEQLQTRIVAAANGASLVDLYGSRAQNLSLPLLRSATAIWQLMQFPPAGIIRQCEADACGGYFLDQSRAKPRRWCSMDGCGNRAKAARHRLTLDV